MGTACALAVTVMPRSAPGARNLEADCGSIYRSLQVRQFVDNMIDVSLNNWYTRQYDNYQVLQKTLSGLFGNW
jgi:hypothetical protein